VRAAIQADVARRLCPHAKGGHFLTWASPANNCPVSRGKNFKATLAGAMKRTITSIIAAAAPPARPDPVSPEALWLWDETVQSGWLVSTLIPDRQTRPPRDQTGQPAGNPDRGYPAPLARIAHAQCLLSPPL
jgi:hypothetical protein